MTDLLADASAVAAADVVAEAGESEMLARHGIDIAEGAATADSFVQLVVPVDAIERSRRELGTPEWALGEGVRQVTYFNLARGRRDLKMLRGTREEAGALWELRHRDGRHPVRVMYRYVDGEPRVAAIVAKQDDAHQRRMIERVRAW